MKLFVVCFVIILVVAITTAYPPDSPVENKLMEEASNYCIETEKPTADDLESCMKHQIPTTETGRCFVGCMVDKLGFLKNGAFARDVADEMVKKQLSGNDELIGKYLQANAACEKEVGTDSDKCTTGPKLMACFMKLHREFM